MAIKAVVLGIDVLPKNETEFTAKVAFASLPDGSGLSGQMDVDIEASELPTVIESVIKAAVKGYLQGQGVTFGPLDTVRLLGSPL